MKSAFIINLSRGEKVKIDEDEMPKFIDGVKRGNIIIFRQGIVNPSFVISITKDIDRMRSYWDDVGMLENRRKTYPDEKLPKEIGIRPLQDIFAEIRGNKMLENPNQGVNVKDLGF